MAKTKCMYQKKRFHKQTESKVTKITKIQQHLQSRRSSVIAEKFSITTLTLIRLAKVM